MSNVITTINLCRVPITPVHQLDFKTKTLQEKYFNSKKIVTYNNCSYQARTSTLKVNAYVDDYNIQNANYGYYKNKYNGVEKIFYFFILNKNYSANGTTELTILIDVFQTWIFDFQFQPCMVERKIVTDDRIGANTFPENFELGDYITHNRIEVSEMTGDVAYVLAITPKDDNEGHIYGKQFSAFTYEIYDRRHISSLSNRIAEIVEDGEGDSIAYIFTMPQGFFTIAQNGVILAGDEGITRISKTYNWNKAVGDFEFNGQKWQPYNSKMYTYPYNFITIKDSRGSNVVLKWELFNDLNNVNFYIDSVFTQNPTFVLTPRNYSNRLLSLEDSLQTDGFGLCSWNNDNYANWYAQHQNSIVSQSVNASASMNSNNNVSNNNYSNNNKNRDLNAIKDITSGTIGALNSLAYGNIAGATGNIIGGAINTGINYQQATNNNVNDLVNNNMMNTTNYENQIRSIMGSVKDAQVQPNTAKGDTSSTGLDLARGTVTFFIEQTTIKPEYAQKIDMYFQMFGYKVNSIEVPVINSKKRWNYLQTVNAIIQGSIPLEDIRFLEEMYNNGLTIWHDETYMYQYNVPNLNV